MAYQVGSTSNLILTNVRTAMKAVNPAAKPEKSQELLAEAIAEAIKSTLTAVKVFGVGAGPSIPTPTGPAPGIGMAIDPKTMADTAEQIVILSTGGSSGIALRPYLDAVFLSVSTSLVTSVEIVPTTGLGGVVTPAVGAVPDLIEGFILAALPPEISSQILNSSNGSAFLKAIATGLSVGISTGAPGPIPFGVPASTGPIVATLK